MWAFKLRPVLFWVREAVSFNLRWLEALAQPPVVVAAMGKVGSRAVAASLQKAHLPNPVFHTHYLSVAHIEEVQHVARESGWQASGLGLQQGQALSRLRDLTKGRLRWKVISLTREPVVRDISDLFQNPHHFPGLEALQGKDLATAVISELKKGLAAFDPQRDYAATWFDREIKAVFGLDIYATPFDMAAGYTIYSAENADLLVMRQEDLARCAPEAFREFLGLENFELLCVNEGAQKAYKEAYRQVLETIVFPVSDLERIYSCAYAQHFYTPVEIERFKRRWQEK